MSNWPTSRNDSLPFGKHIDVLFGELGHLNASRLMVPPLVSGIAFKINLFGTLNDNLLSSEVVLFEESDEESIGNNE